MTAQTPNPARRLGLLQIIPWAAMAAMAVAWRRDHERALKADLKDPRKMPAKAFEAAEPHRGRAADKPQEIPRAGWKDILWRTFKEVGEDRLPIVAAGITFYALLAIFPALGAFVSLYGLFADVGTVEQQLRQMSVMLPAGAIEMLGQQMMRLATTGEGTLSTAFAVGLALSLWSANAGMRALFIGVNIAYDETERRNWFRQTLLTLGFTAGALIFLVAVSAILVGLPLMFEFLGLYGRDLWWIPLRWVLVLFLVMAALSALYRFGPSREKAQWRWVTWGGAFAAVAWLVGSMLYSAYLNAFMNFDKTYGTLGTVIGFMLWVWFSSLVILLGAELNAELEHQTAKDTTTGAPLPMGTRGAEMADTVGLKFSGFWLTRGARWAWGKVTRQPKPARPRGSPGAPPGPRRSAAR